MRSMQFRMTTRRQLPGRVDLTVHGIDADGAGLPEPDDRPALHARARARRGRARRGRRRSSSTPASTPGRSPKDKFVVASPSEERIWWGEVNQPLDREQLRAAAREGGRAPRQPREPLRRRRLGRRRPGAPHRGAGRDARSPYHALFARTMFIDPAADELDGFAPRRARAARARPRGRPGHGRHAHRHVRSRCIRPAPRC